MLGSWRAEGACGGGGCRRGVEGADSGALLWLSAESGALASLLGSALEGAAWALARGVGAALGRASVAFRTVGFSGEVSSPIVGLHGIDKPQSQTHCCEWEQLSNLSALIKKDAAN